MTDSSLASGREVIGLCLNDIKQISILTAVPYLASKERDAGNLRHLHIHYFFSLPVKMVWCLQYTVGVGKNLYRNTTLRHFSCTSLLNSESFKSFK